MNKLERLLWPLAALLLLVLGLIVAGPQIAARQPQGGAWASTPPMPIFRSEHNATVLNGKIYVGGGLAGPNQFFTATTDVFQVYDPLAAIWTNLTPLPERLHHFGIATLNGRIYVTGGYTGDDFNIDNKAVYVYTPQARQQASWKQVANMPSERAAHASVAAGGLLYVVGGVGPDAAATWTYNPATNAWSASRVSLPTLREHITAAVVNDRIYVISGRWGSQNIGTVEEYNPATNTWTSKAPIPTARSGITSAVLDGKIHVTDGEDLSSANTYYQHEVYDPATDTWATLPRMPTARHGLASGAANGRWFVIGGGLFAGNQTYSSLTNIVEAFTPSQAGR
jgi:N-acetylneuraminic acid mutarotase